MRFYHNFFLKSTVDIFCLLSDNSYEAARDVKMFEVWIVMRNDLLYDHNYVAGVFATVELADAFLQGKRVDSHVDGRLQVEYYSKDKHTVQGAS